MGEAALEEIGDVADHLGAVIGRYCRRKWPETKPQTTNTIRLANSSHMAAKCQSRAPARPKSLCSLFGVLVAAADA